MKKTKKRILLMRGKGGKMFIKNKLIFSSQNRKKKTLMKCALISDKKNITSRKEKQYLQLFIHTKGVKMCKLKINFTSKKKS